MKNYSRTLCSNDEVSRNFDASLAHNYESVADLLADLGEFDARRLYVPKAFDSMHAYCVEVKRMTPDAAFKHIRVARTARRFPAVFFAVADGRLHLSAVLLLTPHLTPDTVDELLAILTRNWPRGQLRRPRRKRTICPSGSRCRSRCLRVHGTSCAVPKHC